MSLVTPIALGLLVLVIPVLWAFLARRRTKRRVVSSVLLLKVVASSMSTRRVSLNVRHWVSLSLVLLALLAMLVAIAEPRLGDARPGRILVVLDTSSSMAATSSSGTRLDEALRLLEGRLSLGVPGDRAALITASSATRLRLGLTSDLQRVLRVARSVRAGGGGQALRSALQLADTLCADPEVDEIVLLSDGSGVDLPDLNCDVSFTSVGVPDDNVGISTLTTRRADGLGLSEVLIGVDHAGRQDRSVEVELRVDDRLVDVVPMDLPARGAAWSLRSLEVSGDVLTAQIVGNQDALQLDDRAVIVRAPLPPTSVLLVTDRPGGFVARALELHPGVSLRIASPSDVVDSAPVDLLILEASGSTLPAAAKIVAFGGGLNLVVKGALPLSGPIEITRWDFDHALFRYVELGDVLVQQGWRLTGGVPLIESGDDVIAVGTSVGDVPVVAFGFRAEETDLVMRVGFVNLLANAVEWADPAPTMAAPAQLGRVWTAAPDGASLSMGDNTLQGWMPLDRAGIWRVRDVDGRPVGDVAAKPVGSAEISLAPRRDLGVRAITVGVGGAAWWVWLLGSAAVLLLIEWSLSALLGWWRS